MAEFSNPYEVAEDLTELPDDPDPASGVCGVSSLGELIVSTPAALPRVCVVTGRRENLVASSRTIYWAPSWTILLIFASCLPGAIVYLFMRRDLQIRYFLSQDERRRRRHRFLTGLGCFVAGVGCLFLVFSLAADEAWAFITCLLLAFLGLIAGALIMDRVNPISVSRYTNGRFHLSGLSQELLDESSPSGS